MGKYISINIPQGCKQDWDMMEQRPEGKHCGSCKKTVIDFTLMTDVQLANFLKNNTANVCGRFYNDQLDKQIALPKRELPWLKYFFTITLPAFLFSQKSWGQKINNNIDTAFLEKKKLNEVFTTTPISSRILKGIVVDVKGNPVSFASVMVVGTHLGTQANDKGNFQIKLKDTQNIITISAIGFGSKIVDVRKKEILRITLSESKQAYMGMFVTYKVKNKNLKKSIKYKSDFNSINIFPNPIFQNSKLNIPWQNKITSSQFVEIFNAQGSSFQKETIQPVAPTHDAFILLKQIPTGFYIIRITDTKTRLQLSKEFIVQSSRK